MLENGKTILSREGTTQGDPLHVHVHVGMVMYAIGIRPLVKHPESVNIEQIWYADDSTAEGDLET